MIIKELHCDVRDYILKADHSTAIIHQCNCFNTMGAGIAKAITSLIPEARSVDQATKKGDRSKLGTFTKATQSHVTVYNAYGQYDYGRNPNKVYTDYGALKSALELIRADIGDKDTTIVIPKYIGAGLANGDHKKILNEIIIPIFRDIDTILIY